MLSTTNFDLISFEVPTVVASPLVFSTTVYKCHVLVNGKPGSLHNTSAGHTSKSNPVKSIVVGLLAQWCG
jgi:hypothetical protein